VFSSDELGPEGTPAPPSGVADILFFAGWNTKETSRAAVSLVVLLYWALIAHSMP
jgi:hypothetical protein